MKKIYLILHPEEGDIKTVKYRKDIPQHRLYFHEYAPPDKITYKVRQIVDWLNDPETRKTPQRASASRRARTTISCASSRSARTAARSRACFMNLLLLRAGYPPAIVHSTERQRYYEALKGSADDRPPDGAGVDRERASRASRSCSTSTRPTRAASSAKQNRPARARNQEVRRGAFSRSGRHDGRGRDGPHRAAPRTEPGERISRTGLPPLGPRANGEVGKG